jgi:hypothetical protein
MRLLAFLFVGLVFGSEPVTSAPHRFNLSVRAYDMNTEPLDIVVRGSAATLRMKGRADTLSLPATLRVPAQLTLDIESGEIVFESRAPARWVGIDVAGNGGDMNGAGRCVAFAVRGSRASLKGVACPGE